MNCAICGKPVVLVPSAIARALKYDGKPSDYTRLFRTHAQCSIDKRRADTLTLIRWVRS